MNLAGLFFILTLHHRVHPSNLLKLVIADDDHGIDDYEPDLLKQGVEWDDDLLLDVPLYPQHDEEDHYEVPDVGGEAQGRLQRVVPATREDGGETDGGGGEGRRLEVILVTRTVEGEVRDRVVVVRRLEVDKRGLIEVKGRIDEFLHDGLELIMREALQTLGKDGIIESHEAFLDHLKA